MHLPEIFLILLLVVYSVSLPPLLKRAGLKSSLGYIPLVNFFPALKMIKRPWWWFILILVPGVNLVMIIIINVEIGIAFNKRSTADQWSFAILPWLALPKLAFKEKAQIFVGPRDWKGKKKSFAREWGEAIVFAIVAASVIRTFFFEAFTIPTPSMEKSMLVGDYLFVSKLSYGPKVPQTPMSIPFIHNAIPGTMINSYVEWLSLPYFRLPGLGKVERFDPVVFNFPHGDTIIVDPVCAGFDYYDILRNEAISMSGDYNKYKSNPELYEAKARSKFENEHLCDVCKSYNKTTSQIGGIRSRPVDKEENYIKRCIGLPGEDLSIVNRQVMINGKAIENPEDMMWSYGVAVNDASKNKVLADKLNMPNLGKEIGAINGSPVFRFSLTKLEFEELSKMSYIDTIITFVDTLASNNYQSLFPNVDMEPYRHWTKDNFGPVHIPASGETVQLTSENIEMFRRAIDVYENNDIEIRNGEFFINGKKATSYTFKYNYFWMMGDNRHNSLDARYFGFVPETHVVGKAVFTWFSKSSLKDTGKSNIRWNRMFRTVD